MFGEVPTMRMISTSGASTILREFATLVNNNMSDEFFQ